MAAVSRVGTAAGSAPRGDLTIGKVVAALAAEFPDISKSKIRYLDDEGIVVPARTESGYRRYTEADVGRLRYVLQLQRDQYLPLKVIKEQLDGAGEGVTPIVRPEQFRATPAERLDRAELAERAGVEDAFVDDLVASKLLFPDAMDGFGLDDVAIASTAGKLRAYGLDARHLRSLRSSVRREADLIASAVLPLAKAPNKGGAEGAEDRSREMAALVTTLHAALLNHEVQRGMSR